MTALPLEARMQIQESLDSAVAPIARARNSGAINLFATNAERRVLVVDWAEKPDSHLGTLLRKNNFYAVFVDRPDRVLHSVQHVQPSLILLASAILKDNAAAVFTQIKSLTNAPIVVWADDSNEWEWDCVMMLGMGADDYLEKSSSTRIFIARLRAAIRRAEEADFRIRSSTPSPIEKFSIEPGSNTVLYSGSRVPLSATDFVVFRRLFESVGKVVKHDELLRSINQPTSEHTIHALGMRIHRIRRQCELVGVPKTAIRNVRNEGYALTGN